jgi:hypothetical protein
MQTYPKLPVGTSVHRLNSSRRGIGTILSPDEEPDYYMVKWPRDDDGNSWESSCHISVLRVLG